MLIEGFNPRENDMILTIRQEKRGTLEQYVMTTFTNAVVKDI